MKWTTRRSSGKRAWGREAAAPTCFHCPAKGARALKHGDDFVIAGPRKHTEYVRDKMREWYDVKVGAMLGQGAGDNRAIVILGRQIRWLEDRLEIEADERLARAVRASRMTQRVVGAGGARGRRRRRGHGARPEGGVQVSRSGSTGN